MNRQPVEKSAERPPAESVLALGLRYERSGNDKLARAEYLKAVEHDPKSLQAHQRLGAVCDRLGMFDEAEQHYLKTLELSPRNPDLYNDLGYSYYLRGRPAESEKALRQCLALNANHARAHNNLGLLLGRQGRTDESMTEFRRAGATEEQAAAALAWVSPPHKAEVEPAGYVAPAKTSRRDAVEAIQQ